MRVPKPGEGGDFAPAPAGTFTATCFRFVDLGSHKQEFQGNSKIVRKVLISWELTDELMEDGKPFTISKRYSWSMHEKSTLRKDLETWRGKPFEANDFGESGFDTRKLLGKPCTLTITHSVKDGKTYSNVGGIGQVMRGVQVKPLVNEQVYLALEQGEFDPAVFEKMSDGLKKLITASPEYAELTGQKAPAQQPVGLSQQLDDDIPF